MEQLTYRFSLDTHKNGVQRTLQGFETGNGISRKLVINLVEEDRPFMLPLDNVVAAMYVKRPSQSSPSINTCSIDGDQIVYELTDSDLEEAGIVTCQVKLIFGTIEHPLNVIVSPRFDIEVWESMASDSVAEDTQEYTALEAALAKAQMCYEGRIISFSIDDSTGVLTVVYGYDEETQTHVTYTSDYFKDNLTPTIEVGTVTEGDVMSVTNSGTALHAIFDFILKKGEKGDDGFSAVANVVKSGDTATITITDKTGTTTAEISDGADGQDGQDGQDGADGYSPTASVTKSGDTATITITDKNGTTTAEISDGADGQDGQDGQDGADGYSPTATVVKNGSTATITITDKNGTTTAQVSDGTGTTTAWNQIQQSGDKIAEITINGTKTDVYNEPISTATQTALNSKTDNTMVANVETTTTATQRYEIGDNFIYNGVLYEATAIIPNGATITVGTNCKVSDNITKLIQNAAKKAKARKYIFVGDSYSAGTYGATGWIDLVNSILGLTSGVDSFDARGNLGGSFSDGSFKNQLTVLLTTIDAPQEITDIYVFAGQNEYTYTDSVCLDKIADFISYANTNFPNAKVHLGFIGRGNDPQYFDAMNAKCRCYIQGAMENGADYVNNIEYVNRMYTDYNADKIHPNSYTDIANYIALGIVNGSVDVQRSKSYSVTATSNASGAVSIVITQSNELIMVDMAAVLSSFTADIISGGSMAGTKLANVDFDIVGQNFEIPFMANVRNAQNQFSNEYLFIVRSGSDLKIKCNKLIASGWQNIPAPSDVSNMNISRTVYSAMKM